jgi:hypothetical protein
LGTYNCQDLSLSDSGHTVQLGNPDENFAFQKKAIQSTIHGGFGANLAVDGNRDPAVNHGSCAHTTNSAPSWWAVDLEQELSIGRVRITNRNDLYPELLKNFFIGLTNVSPWVTPPVVDIQTSICKYYTGYPAPGIPINIFCEPDTQPGRYLFIKHSISDWLIICEVEAFVN